MAGRIIKYLLIFFAMYFLGHFIMTMAYRFGDVPTIAIGILSLIIIIFTFLKAARLSGSRKEIFYGIFSGLFMWVFFGEFLEHMGIVEIVDPGFFPLLTAYVFIVSFFVYKKYLPVGVSFALGHFGCIWLVHSIGIYQAELLKPQNPEAYQMLRSATGIIFLLTFLFLSFKLFKARSERAQVAYTLFAFIFLWSVVETLQVFHIVPDYTYYSYWARKISPASSEYDRNSSMLKIEKLIESFNEEYAWESEETKELAVYLLNKLSAPLIQDDLNKRMDKRMKEENKEKVGEAMICQVIEESISATMLANFKNQIKRYVQEFKEEKPVKNYFEPETTKLKNAQLSDRYEKKIASIKEQYEWENKGTKELVVYLMKRLHLPSVLNDITKRLDEKIKGENHEKVGEVMFCQVIEESISTVLAASFNNSIRRYVREFKEQRSVRIGRSNLSS